LPKQYQNLYFPTIQRNADAASIMALAPSHALVVAPFTALCAFLALALLFLYSKATSSSKKTQQLLPPGPAGLPIIGSLHCVVSKRPVFRWIHGLLKDMDTNVLCLRFGAVHVVVVACPETAREVLRTNDAVLASRPETVASALFSFGYKGSILTPYGEQWKKMRRVLSSEILSASMEQRLQRRRAQEADYLVGFLYSQCSASAAACCCSAVDVRHVARHFCGNMIRTLVFGKRHFSGGGGGGGPGPEEVTHMDALFTLLNYVYCFSVSDYVPAAWTWMVAGDHKKVAESVMETLSRLHDPIIRERIREWEGLRERGDRREARDFLDALVSLEDAEGQPFLSFDEIKAQTAVRYTYTPWLRLN
jgi:tyrosine N-monooxygenase